jgi:hypothetical protein
MMQQDGHILQGSNLEVIMAIARISMLLPVAVVGIAQ